MLLQIQTKHSGKKAISRALPRPCARAARRSCSDSESRKGLKVLDLGCGDGTTALPAAKLGAEVLGVDIARNLVEAGTKRAAEHGLTNCTFQEGDASNLEQVPDQVL